MSTYIDKNTLYGKVDDLIRHAGEKGQSITIEILARTIVPLIVSIPAQDVQPVTHAKWIHPVNSDLKIWVCSNCGGEERNSFKREFGSYCSYCGAKMDGD